jgi:hypothetical protein
MPSFHQGGHGRLEFFQAGEWINGVGRPTAAGRNDPPVIRRRAVRPDRTDEHERAILAVSAGAARLSTEALFREEPTDAGEDAFHGRLVLAGGNIAHVPFTRCESRHRSPPVTDVMSQDGKYYLNVTYYRRNIAQTPDMGRLLRRCSFGISRRALFFRMWSMSHNGISHITYF